MTPTGSPFGLYLKRFWSRTGAFFVELFVQDAQFFQYPMVLPMLGGRLSIVVSS